VQNQPWETLFCSVLFSLLLLPRSIHNSLLSADHAQKSTLEQHKLINKCSHAAAAGMALSANSSSSSSSSSSSTSLSEVRTASQLQLLRLLLPTT
jgi:hypothetical protein